MPFEPKMHDFWEIYCFTVVKINSRIAKIRLGEALAIVLHFVQKDCKPTQRLVHLEVLAKPLKGNELAQRLMTCIAVNHNFGPNMVFAVMRDGAADNGAAIKQLRFFYSIIMDVIFFSHTINNVGCHFVFRVLDTFFRHWINLFAHSYNAKLLWKERTESRCVITLIHNSGASGSS